MISACLEAHRVTGDARWRDRARVAFNWFLGQNQLQQPLYDATTGGCRDGLHADRVNENQGAESTLSFLLALVEMRAADRADATQHDTGDDDMSHTGKTRGYETLFHRHAGNPILTAADWPYPAHTVFNAGATRLADGTTLLLCRVEDRRGHSHLCAARSANGIDGWVIDEEPTLRPDPEHYPEELWGIEDPRITFVDGARQVRRRLHRVQQGRPGRRARADRGLPHASSATASSCSPTTRTRRCLPRRIDGNFALIHRPMTDSGAHIWISYSPDLRNWGSHKLILPGAQGRAGGTPTRSASRRR